MLSTIRLQEIFTMLTNHTYTTIQELEEAFHVTGRTIRADISNLNEELSTYDCEVLLKRKHGYYLKVNNQEKYEQLKEDVFTERSSFSLDSVDNRISSILFQLLYAENYISLDDLADSVYVSRATIQGYMKTIKTILEKYNLMYLSKNNKGIRIFGDEKDKRECLVDMIHSDDSPNYIVEFSDMEQHLFRDIDLEALTQIVSKYFSSVDLQLSDYEYKNLILHIALMLSRVQTENYIPFNPEFPIPSDIETMINTICDMCESYFDVQITKGEKQYIYLHLVSNSKLNIGQINPDVLNKNIIDLLELVYQEYSFDLRNDETLKKDLFNHFSSILSAKNIRSQKKNPLLNTIKMNFPLAFEITLTTTSVIFPNLFNDDEVGYISLHIGAAIERCFSGQYDRKNVLLVCGSGIATTRMLEARLDAFFKNKINIVNKISYQTFREWNESNFSNIDFVISTIPLKSSFIPIEIVDFSLTKKDVESITRRLSMIHKHDEQIGHFFDANLFVHETKQVTKTEILTRLASLLEKEEFIDKTYLESVLKRESLAKTNMNTLFAIPHPMTPTSDQTKVAVAILDKPVIWNDEGETVQIIFMLCMKAQDQKDIEHLYDIFIEMVNNTKLQQNILKAHDFNMFYTMISTALN